MNQFGVILALLFSMIIALFAIANNQPIEVNYLYGRAEVSAVIVILGAAILGALVIFLLNLFRQFRTGFQIRSLRQEIASLQDKFQEVEAERDSLLVQLGQLQESGEEASRDVAFESDLVNSGELTQAESNSEAELHREASYQEEFLPETQPEKTNGFPAEEPEKKEDDDS